MFSQETLIIRYSFIAGIWMERVGIWSMAEFDIWYMPMFLVADSLRAISASIAIDIDTESRWHLPKTSVEPVVIPIIHTSSNRFGN